MTATVLKIWAKRHRDLSRTRNQVVCRLHAVLCDLIPGGVSKQIRAAAAARVLEQARPSGAVQQARHELAAEFLAGLRRVDAQLRETRKKLATAVRACGTTVTGIFGVGPAIAATVIGDVRDISRFPSRDRFAAYNGTAPVEVSSGNRVIYRLSLRGNRRLNHAIHMAAVTQIRYQHSPGRAYYDKKIAEGKTSKEALRALKRKISDAIYKHLKADAARAASSGQGPGGHPGNGSSASVAGSHPERRLFGQATPGPAPTLRRPDPAEAACRAQHGQAPGLPALPAPRGRRGSGINGRPKAVARNNAASLGGAAGRQAVPVSVGLRAGIRARREWRSSCRSRDCEVTFDLDRSSVGSVCHGYRAVPGDGRRGRVRPGSSGRADPVPAVRAG